MIHTEEGVSAIANKKGRTSNTLSAVINGNLYTTDKVSGSDRIMIIEGDSVRVLSISANIKGIANKMSTNLYFILYTYKGVPETLYFDNYSLGSFCYGSIGDVCSSSDISLDNWVTVNSITDQRNSRILTGSFQTVMSGAAGSYTIADGSFTVTISK